MFRPFSRQVSPQLMGRWGAPSYWTQFLLIAATLTSVLILASAMTGVLSGETSPYTDYKYFHIPAQCWLEGASPYGPCPAAMWAESPVFDSADRMHAFVYPPTILPVLAPMGLMPIELARTIWFVASLGALALAARLFAAFLFPDSDKEHARKKTLLILTCLALLPEAGIYMFVLGQFTPFLILAFAAYLHAVKERRTVLLSVALTALLFKPPLGIALGFVIFLDPKLRPAALLSCLFSTGLLGLYALQAPAGQIITEYLSAVSTYANPPQNWPQHMSGLSHLAYYLNGTGYGSITGLALTLALISAAYILRIGKGLYTDTTGLALFALWALMVIMPAHSYDYLLAAPLLILPLMRQPLRPEGLMVLTGALMLAKCFTLSAALYTPFFAEKTQMLSLINTIGIMLIVGGLALSSYRRVTGSGNAGHIYGAFYERENASG